MENSVSYDEPIAMALGLGIRDGKLAEALEILMALEKKVRAAQDLESSSKVLLAIIQLCFENGNWEKLNELIEILVKKPSHLKEALIKMIKKCVELAIEAPNKAIKLKLVETLRNATEGKLFAEVEYARVTKMLAEIKEADGDIDGAAKIIQELQIEAYGTMKHREKIELFLEQMRLCLAKQDSIRVQVISNKVSKKILEEDGNDDLKVKYYSLMIELDRERSFLNCSRYCQALICSKKVQQCPEELKSYMTGAVMYCILASHNNERSDMLYRLKQHDFVEKSPLLKKILSLFLSKELISHQEFCISLAKDLRQTLVFDQETSRGQKCWMDLKERIVDHNILIISTYYTRIYMTRIAELLDLPIKECEEHLGKLVNDGSVFVKIDRPLGIVTFGLKKTGEEVLNDWSNNLSKLMQMVDHTHHIIHQEEIRHFRITDGIEKVE